MSSFKIELQGGIELTWIELVTESTPNLKTKLTIWERLYNTSLNLTDILTESTNQMILSGIMIGQPIRSMLSAPGTIYQNHYIIHYEPRTIHYIILNPKIRILNAEIYILNVVYTPFSFVMAS